MNCMFFETCGNEATEHFDGIHQCCECYWFTAFYNGGLRGDDLFKRVSKVCGN